VTITGVQIGGRDGLWLRVGDIVIVKKTGQKGKVSDISWRYNPLKHKYDGHVVTVEYANPCVGYDEDEQDLSPEDVEFDILEKMARVAREGR
jgi:hypothetical protein